jgi:hypothetical protein
MLICSMCQRIYDHDDPMGPHRNDRPCPECCPASAVRDDSSDSEKGEGGASFRQSLIEYIYVDETGANNE